MKCKNGVKDCIDIHNPDGVCDKCMRGASELNNILKEAVKRYGVAQLDMCIEEMSELTKEICKFKRDKLDRNHIIEEIVDVEIMLEQLKFMLHVEGYELDNFRESKINRLADKLGVERMV